jgi:hypothetical protein
MSDAASSTATSSDDPLHPAADAMALALQAARDGASDARERVSEVMPAVGGFLSRLTYTTCYAVSFGVVFPVLLAARAVPKNNSLVHGLLDGARAAREALEGRLGEAASSPAGGEHPHIHRIG